MNAKGYWAHSRIHTFGGGGDECCGVQREWREEKERIRENFACGERGLKSFSWAYGGDEMWLSSWEGISSLMLST